jgi:hypothetical protein
MNTLLGWWGERQCLSHRKGANVQADEPTQWGVVCVCHYNRPSLRARPHLIRVHMLYARYIDR